MGLGVGEFGSAPASEKRSAPRRRTLRTASLVFNDRNSTIDATLRDISETGARVRVHAAFDCPTRLLLKLADGTARQSEVRWFRNLEIGLRFEGDPGMIGAPSPLRVWGLYRDAEKLSPANLLRELRAMHHLGDTELEALADDWHRAYEAFLAKLHPRACTPKGEES